MAFQHRDQDGATPAAPDHATTTTTTLAEDLKAHTVSRAYQCQCGRPVFLGNSQCLACHTPLGYVTEQLGVMPLALVPPPPAAAAAEAEAADAPPPPDTFTVFGDDGGTTWRRCANFLSAAGCNWMVPVARPGTDEPAAATDGLVAGYCLSCSLTRTIPDLSEPRNGDLWRKLEQAKRRVVSQLLVLGLPVITRAADPVQGLAFDFLSNMPGGPHVLTGHRGGVITLNAEEAEDVVRERIRTEMREPYRTLVGHFRHEIGHYYWDLLVQPTPRLDAFRALFGDERADYAAALRQHYDNGPPPDWSVRFVTGYASAHPWEDWAETWAHYLHMSDMADTALSFGMDAANVELASDLFAPEDLWQPEHPDAQRFLDFLNGWVRLTNVLNELSRSMGQPDYYPFVLPRAAVGKLQFVHVVITGQREAAVAEAAPEPEAPEAEARAEADAEPEPPIEHPAPDQTPTQTGS